MAGQVDDRLRAVPSDAALRDHDTKGVDGKKAMKGLTIRYLSRATALTAPNSSLNGMFHVNLPNEGYRAYPVLN